MERQRSNGAKTGSGDAENEAEKSAKRDKRAPGKCLVVRRGEKRALLDRIIRNRGPGPSVGTGAECARDVLSKKRDWRRVRPVAAKQRIGRSHAPGRGKDAIKLAIAQRLRQDAAIGQLKIVGLAFIRPE